MDDQQLREKAKTLDLYQAQMEALARQSDLLRATMDEYLRARDTLNGFKDLKRGEETLVPIGANFFVYCTVKNSRKVIGSVGSNVAVEEPAEKALKRLDARISEMNETGQRISKAIEDLEGKSQALYQEIQGAAGVGQKQ